MKLIRVNSRHRGKKSRNIDALPNINRAHIVTTDCAPPSSPSTKTSPSTLTITCLPKRLLVCFAALAVLTVAVVLTVIYTVDVPLQSLDEDDYSYENMTGTAKFNISGHRFYSLRAWGGREPLSEVPVTLPVNFVIISHTAGPQCFTFAECAAQMRNIQAEHVSNGSPNIGYNFVIGADGDIYEGRGWHVRNFHRDATIGVCFFGNYVYDEVTAYMIDAMDKLLEQGVEKEVLARDYYIIAHNHTFNTLSPGQNLYKVIKQYPNFYREMIPQMRN